MHEVAFNGLPISTEQIEQAFFRPVLGKLTVPLGTVVDGGGQCHNDLGVHGQAIGLRFQQSAGLLIDPVPQCLIKFLAAHLTPEGRCVVILCQPVHGGLVKVHRLIQPKGVCENAGHSAVVTVICVPNAGRLSPQSFNAFTAQQVKDLLSALSVCYFRQHGKGHIHIQRRIDLVLSVGAAEKFTD